MREYKVGDKVTWKDGNPAECVGRLHQKELRLLWIVRCVSGDYLQTTDRRSCSCGICYAKPEKQKLYVYRSDCGAIRAFDSGGPRSNYELIATTTFTEGAFVDDEDNE